MSNNLVTIRAISSPGKIFSGAKMKKEVMSASGEKQEITTGNYKGVSFPGSIQILAPFFDIDKGEFQFELTNDELQDLVKKAQLTDNKGNIITSASLRNRRDPFISQLQVIMREGQATLNPSKPAEKALLHFLAARDKFIRKGESAYISARVKYMITDYELDQKVDTKKVDTKLKAFEYLGALTAEKQLKVAGAMNISVSDKTDASVIRNEIFNRLDSGAKDPYGVPYADVFIRLCELPSEELEIKYKIFKARKTGVLKKTKQGWMLFGQTVAQTDDDLEGYFSNIDNQEMLIKLDTALQKV